MKLYFRMCLHVCHTYSAVFGCHVANTITTFVYNLWTYVWYQIVANKHLFHIKIGNNYNTATKIFLAAYINYVMICATHVCSLAITIGLLSL